MEDHAHSKERSLACQAHLPTNIKVASAGLYTPFTLAKLGPGRAKPGREPSQDDFRAIFKAIYSELFQCIYFVCKRKLWPSLGRIVIHLYTKISAGQARFCVYTGKSEQGPGLGRTLPIEAIVLLV